MNVTIESPVDGEVLTSNTVVVGGHIEGAESAIVYASDDVTATAVPDAEGDYIVTLTLPDGEYDLWAAVSEDETSEHVHIQVSAQPAEGEPESKPDEDVTAPELDPVTPPAPELDPQSDLEPGPVPEPTPESAPAPDPEPSTAPEPLPDPEPVPDAPVITSPEPGEVITGPVTVTGTGVDPDTILLYDGDTELNINPIQVSDEGWNFRVDLEPGVHTLSATERNEHGNLSDASDAVTFTVESVPEAPPEDDADAHFAHFLRHHFLEASRLGWDLYAESRHHIEKWLESKGL